MSRLVDCKRGSSRSAFHGWLSGLVPVLVVVLNVPGGTSVAARPPIIQVPTISERPSRPSSVTLSPDGNRLAVTIENGVESDLRVLDLGSGRWTHSIIDADPTAVRWHPYKPLLIVGNFWGTGYPAYFMADVRTGKRWQIVRGDIHAFCWSHSAMLMKDVLLGIDPFTNKLGKWGNFGYRIPWDAPYTDVNRLSCGPGGRVAAELYYYGPSRRVGERAQRLDMYRKAPNRMQWVRVGRINPGTDGRKVIWYPNNPNFLDDGRLVYLRIYPAYWTHPFTSSGKRVPEADTAKNKVEVWVCSLKGTNQRKVLTLTDLRPYIENPSADWFTIDRAGRVICYLDNQKIRILRLSQPLSSVRGKRGLD